MARGPRPRRPGSGVTVVSRPVAVPVSRVQPCDASHPAADAWYLTPVKFAGGAADEARVAGPTRIGRSTGNRAMSAKIAVDDLRVGMFVHLDLGWWAHPFALSSFKGPLFTFE